MSLHLRRRHFLAATAGLTLMGAPSGLLAATMAKGFTHGVASGEPAAASILLWTRFVGSGDMTTLSVELAEDAEFGRMAARGEAVASEATGHCAKVVLTGLNPATWYFYRFRAPSGEVSQIGRTRTLPAGGMDPFAMAVFSCSNLPFGYFNAYAHAAERNDVHLAVHLGDYLYEYPVGSYPSRAQMVPGRSIDPAHETVSPDDYHRRYAVYRADRDLQRLHQVLPMIAIWDDHEIANDAWKGGAQNHQSDEGSWDVRKAVAKAAYRHWMPVSDEPYKSYDIGDLATLFRVDTRIEGRDEQLDVPAILKEAGSVEAGLQRLLDIDYVDPERTLMGSGQETWLQSEMERSVAGGKRWQLLAQQVVMGSTYVPPEVRDWIDPDTTPGYVKSQVDSALLLASAGIPRNLDSWGGYPAARSRLLAGAQTADANLIVLAGDSHNSWAFDLAEGGAAAGVEFAVSSVTSPGYEAYFPKLDPRVIANGLVAASSEMKWADTSQRGYGVVRLGAEEASCEWTYVDTIKARSRKAEVGKRLTVESGKRSLTV